MSINHLARPLKTLTKYFFIFTITTFCLARAAQPDPIRIGVASLTHGHAGDVFERFAGGDLEIVGIYEKNQGLVKYYAEQYNLNKNLFFTDLDEMLDKASPEVVTAYGSIYEHLSVVEKCAPRGIHVMVEKPLAFDLDHALAMQKLAKKHNIHIFTNYATTWFPSVHAAYDLVHNQQQIGEVRKVVVHDGHKGPKEIGCGAPFLEWLTDPVQNGGGAIVDFGCYGVNLMTWLMKGARPLTVTAVTQQIKPEIYPHVDDEATIILAYEKAQCIIQASWNWPFDRKDMDIYGKTGTVFAPTGRTLLVRQKAREPVKTQTLEPRAYPYDNPFSFLTAVLRGQIEIEETDLSSLEVNVTVAKILDAARESARTGKTVALQ
jgi:scyllo-inositol 2-dehydrogenase (NADP+)